MGKRWLFWAGIGVLFFVFLFLIRSILLPFVLGMLIAYFLDPAVDRLERCKLSRGVATLSVIAAFFLSAVVLLLLITPLIANQVTGLIAAMPEYVAAFNEKYSERFSQALGGLPSDQIESLKAALGNFSNVIFRVAGDFAAGLFHSGMVLINILSLVLITPIVAFYLLRDWDRVTDRTDNLLPRQHAPTIRQQMIIIDETLAGFLRGQLNVCLLLGVYYAIGLTLVGLKFSLVIGLLTGFLVIFPYVGFMVGMTLAMCVAFFQFDSYTPVIVTFAILMVGQVLESYFLTPKLVGEKVGLHPVWIIFGMLAGAALFGFVGVLLAIPMTAVIGVLIRFAIQNYLQSSYYRGTS